VFDSISMERTIQMHKELLKRRIHRKCISSEGAQTHQLIHHGSSVIASDLFNPMGKLYICSTFDSVCITEKTLNQLCNVEQSKQIAGLADQEVD